MFDHRVTHSLLEQCTNFTPKLKEWHAANAVCSKTGNRKAQIVFVSSDTDKQSALSHFSSHGDWLMLDYDSPLRQELKLKYEVWGGAETQLLKPTSKRRAGIPGVLRFPYLHHPIHSRALILHPWICRDGRGKRLRQGAGLSSH